jgi:hypothetical protein
MMNRCDRISMSDRELRERAVVSTQPCGKVRMTKHRIDITIQTTISQLTIGDGLTREFTAGEQS